MEAIMENTTLKLELDLAMQAVEHERKHVSELVVTTPAEHRVATEALKNLTAKHREIDARRREATRPLDEAKKTILVWFRPALDTLETYIDGLRRQLVRYDEFQRERENKAAEQYGKALATGQTPSKEALASAFATAAPADSGVQTRQTWDFEVTDVSLLPKEYVLANVAKIGSVVRALRGDVVIPGVRVFQKTSLVVKS